MLTEHYAGGRVRALSAGTQPGEHIHQEVADVLEKLGLDTSREHPSCSPATPSPPATVAITLGCGEECPYVPGVKYADWPVDDPGGQDEDHRPADHRGPRWTRPRPHHDPAPRLPAPEVGPRLIHPSIRGRRAAPLFPDVSQSEKGWRAVELISPAGCNAYKLTPASDVFRQSATACFTTAQTIRDGCASDGVPLSGSEVGGNVMCMTSRERTAADPPPPVLGAEFAVDYAAQKAACVRPLAREVTDRVTGASVRVLMPCGSTSDSVCPPCAEKARRLRMQQCAEGWHLGDDPLDDHENPAETQRDRFDEEAAAGGLHGWSA